MIRSIGSIMFFFVFIVSTSAQKIFSAQISTTPDRENNIFFQVGADYYSAFFHMEEGKTLWDTKKFHRVTYCVGKDAKEIPSTISKYKYEDDRWYKHTDTQAGMKWLEASPPPYFINTVMKVRKKIRKVTKGKVPTCKKSVSVLSDLWVSEIECPEKKKKPKTKTIIRGGAYHGF